MVLTIGIALGMDFGLVPVSSLKKTFGGIGNRNYIRT